MSIGDGRVVSNFIVQAQGNKPITIYGSGNQTRSFCFVSDLVDGMIKMMNSDEAFTGPVNLGNPLEISIKTLAETIIELIGSSSKLIYESLPKDDPTRRKPDISLAKEKLKWEPKVGLHEGLRESISYFENII